MPASAQLRAAAGAKLAEQYCAACHVVAPNGAGGWTDAPKFEDVANRPNVSAAKLSAFIQQEHMHMVNTGRPRSEADELAAYILSLRH
jgi:mono/diheme cytochrome c family protein